jgi:hypothetical protein
MSGHARPRANKAPFGSRLISLPPWPRHSIPMVIVEFDVFFGPVHRGKKFILKIILCYTTGGREDLRTMKAASILALGAAAGAAAFSPAGLSAPGTCFCPVRRPSASRLEAGSAAEPSAMALWASRRIAPGAQHCRRSGGAQPRRHAPITPTFGIAGADSHTPAPLFILFSPQPCARSQHCQGFTWGRRPTRVTSATPALTAAVSSRRRPARSRSRYMPVLCKGLPRGYWLP